MPLRWPLAARRPLISFKHKRNWAAEVAAHDNGRQKLLAQAERAAEVAARSEMAIDNRQAQAEKGAEVAARSDMAVDMLQLQTEEVAEVAAHSVMAIDKLKAQAEEVVVETARCEMAVDEPQCEQKSSSRYPVGDGH